MMRTLLILPLALSAAACGDLTKDFIGNWTLTNGTITTVCDSMRTSTPYHVGAITLAVTRMDAGTIAINAAFYSSMGGLGGMCDLTATAADPSSARLNAKACQIGASPYNFIDGSLLLSQSKAMLMNYIADISSSTGPCQQTSTATLAPL